MYTRSGGRSMNRSDGGGRSRSNSIGARSRSNSPGFVRSRSNSFGPNGIRSGIDRFENRNLGRFDRFNGNRFNENRFNENRFRGDRYNRFYRNELINDAGYNDYLNYGGLPEVYELNNIVNDYIPLEYPYVNNDLNNYSVDEYIQYLYNDRNNGGFNNNVGLFLDKYGGEVNRAEVMRCVNNCLSNNPTESEFYSCINVCLNRTPVTVPTWVA